MNYPGKATHNDQNGKSYLWDDTSTADSPVGAQSNGPIFIRPWTSLNQLK